MCAAAKLQVHPVKRIWMFLIFIRFFFTIINQEDEKKRKEEERKQAVAAKNEAERKRKEREVSVINYVIKLDNYSWKLVWPVK